MQNIPKKIMQTRCGNWLVVLLLLIYGQSFTQPTAYYKQLGEQLFKDKKYEEAYSSLKKYYTESPEQKLLLQLAVCAYHLNLMKEANLYLNLLKSEPTKFPLEASLYEARVFYAQKNYTKAVDSYKLFLKKAKANHPLLGKAKLELLQCAYGMRLNRYQDNITTLPVTLNTSYHEEYPLVSPNFPNRLYFTSNRNGNQDIFQTETPQMLPSQITLMEGTVNTTANEIGIGFAENGTTFFYWQDSNWKHTGNDPNKNYFPSTITDQSSNIFIFNDSTLLFASNQLPGFGGFDIYYVQQRQGTWNAPVNLGSKINTPSDEIHPFLFKDGHTLFFSSNYLYASIGKYDILRSQYQDEQALWSEPKNLGTSINTPANELHFTLTKDGQTAFFVSDAWEGQGGKDIYWVRLQEKIIPNPIAVFFADVRQYQQNQLLQQFSKNNTFKGLYYRILLARAATYDPKVILPSYPNPLVQPSLDSKWYDYYIGQFQTFSTALEWLKEIQSTHPKASIIPFFQNAPISPNEVPKYASQYKDLQKYLDFLQGKN